MEVLIGQQKAPKGLIKPRRAFYLPGLIGPGKVTPLPLRRLSMGCEDNALPLPIVSVAGNALPLDNQPLPVIYVAKGRIGALSRCI